MRSMAANYELCHTAVASCNPTIGRAERSSNETLDPATITLSQARSVTLRQGDSFFCSSSTVMLSCHYWHGSLWQPPLYVWWPLPS